MEEVKRLNEENAALKAELLEQCRLNGMGAEREASLKSRVAELELKVKEREQIAIDDCELIYSLRAQLEAAELAARFNGERVSMLEATVTSLTKPQLTAQPDGVGEAAMAELLAKQNSKIAKAHAALEALCGEDPQSEFDEGYCPHCGVRVGNSLPCHDKDHAKGCAFIKGRKALKALAAPAPAREDGACYQCKCVDCGGVFNSQNKRAVVCPSCQVSAADCWRKAFEIARSYNELGNVVSHEDDEEIKRLVAQAQALAAPASSGQPEGGIWIECPRCTGEYADNGCPACEGVGKLKGKALAATAPAPLDKSEGPSTELVYKAAPAPVCQTCGDEKYVFHELDLSKPCPDCAKEGEL